MSCYDTCCRPEPEITFDLLSRRQVRRARKAHRCTDCNGEIPAGSPARAIAALIDGEFWSGYQHVTVRQCAAAVPEEDLAGW